MNELKITKKNVSQTSKKSLYNDFRPFQKGLISHFPKIN